MGSEQHTASLKKRLYKQKIPEGSHSGVFFISVCPAWGRLSAPGSAVSAAARSGRRRCNTTQRQNAASARISRKIRHSAPCAVCAALLSVHPAPACPAGAAPSGHLRDGPAILLPDRSHRLRQTGSRPADHIQQPQSRRICIGTVRTQQPFRLPRNSTVSSARSRHPAAKSAPTRRCAARTRVSFAGTGPPLTRQTFALSFSRTFASA